MPKLEDIDFSRLDYRALSSDQRAWVLRQIVKRAHVERGLALWRMSVALVGGLRRMGAVVVDWYASFRQRRRRRSEAAVLYAFNDHMLKDIGVARCEVDRLVESGRRHAA
jgi:uncharacterized protein YjiS (DUF1127 family)